MADKNQMAKSQYIGSLQEVVRECQAMRMDAENPQDITLAHYVNARWGVSMEEFYQDLGINPSADTIGLLVSMPDTSVRWLIPEIYRDAIRLGYRRGPIYQALIAASQNVKGLEVTQPYYNMSDAAAFYTGVAESIRLGDVSFGQKTVGLRKLARGISVPYEVLNFSALNAVSLFLGDFGIKLGHQKDMLALHTLINGEQANGSESAATIGVATPGTLVYKDLLKPFVRGSRLGRNFATQVSGEDFAIDMLDLDEYSKREAGTTAKNLNIKTPIPQSADLYIHSGVPTNKLLLVDPTLAMIEYNAQALLVEAEKIVSNQTEATYVSLITGFGIAYRDARLLLDKSISFGSNGFPAWMDPSTQEQTVFKK